MQRMVIVVSVMVLAVCQGVVGVHSSAAAPSAFIPNPHLFKLPAKSFPWPTQFLLDARVENNTRAEKDGDVIYDPKSDGLPHWSKLGRVTGWYEDALMQK